MSLQYQVGRHNGSWDQSAQRDVLSSTNQLPVVLTGTADVLQWPNLYILNGAAADLTTLAAPTAGDPQSGGDDGKCLTLVDFSGKAHTVTTPANAIINNKKTLTFNGTIGSCVTLQAWNGVWIVLDPNGVAIS